MNRGRTSRVVMALAGAAVALAIAAAPASAWFETLDSFIGTQGNGFGKQRVTVTKCKGGMLGTYDMRAIVIAGSNNDVKVFHEVKAKLSVRRETVPLRDLDIELEVPDSFDPGTTAAILEDFGSFYDTIETRYRKGQLEVDHGKLVVLGTQVLGPETFIQEFKPKPTCPKPD